MNENKHLPSALTNEEKVSENGKLLLINQNKSNNFEVKSNNELFKQALVEGLNRRFDKTIEEAKNIEQIEEIAVKLNEIIRFNDKGFVDRYATAEMIYNAGYRKQSGWISVEDRLPEKNGQYLVTNGKKTTIEQFSYPNCLTRFDTPSFCFWDNNGDGWWKKLNFPTHWMPLPKAPKMKGGEEE